MCHIIPHDCIKKESKYSEKHIQNVHFWICVISLWWHHIHHVFLKNICWNLALKRQSDSETYRWNTLVRTQIRFFLAAFHSLVLQTILVWSGERCSCQDDFFTLVFLLSIMTFSSSLYTVHTNRIRSHTHIQQNDSGMTSYTPRMTTSHIISSNTF